MSEHHNNPAPETGMPKYRKKDAPDESIQALRIHGVQEHTYTFTMLNPADEGFIPFKVEKDFVKEQKPNPNGYYVVKGGEKLFIPVAQFEKEYEKI